MTDNLDKQDALEAAARKVETARMAVEAAIHADYEVADERLATRFTALDVYEMAIRDHDRVKTTFQEIE